MRLLIDANIYLRFYDSNSKQFKKLLSSLSEIKENIVVTAQIADEVRRNKLNVAVASFNKYLKKLGMQKTTLPEHFDGIENNRMQEWNTKRNKLIAEEEVLRNNFDEIVEETISSIVTSTDKVSVVLEDLFKHTIVVKEHELSAAKKRKGNGNPPGKPDDSLGDQVTWEQLLGLYDGATKLWIISNDHDYCVEYRGKKYLNAFLFQELARKSSSKPDVYCFGTLAEGLTHYNNNSGHKVKALPSDEILKEITIEESLNMRDDLVVSSNIESIGFDENTQTLRVKFFNGATYDYKNVSIMAFEQLKNASSIGSYFNRNIKGNYVYERIG